MGARISWNDGKPHFEVIDDTNGRVVESVSRPASADDVRACAVIDALNSNTYQMELLGQQLRDLATYGISAKVRT